MRYIWESVIALSVPKLSSSNPGHLTTWAISYKRFHSARWLHSFKPKLWQHLSSLIKRWLPLGQLAFVDPQNKINNICFLPKRNVERKTYCLSAVLVLTVANDHIWRILRFRLSGIIYLMSNMDGGTCIFSFRLIRRVIFDRRIIHQTSWWHLRPLSSASVSSNHSYHEYRGPWISLPLRTGENHSRNGITLSKFT